MRKLGLALAGVGVLGLGLYIYFKRQLKLLADYEWKIQSFNVKRFNLQELLLDVTILFRSKADLEARINKVYLDVFLEGKNVGFVTENKPFILPAKGSALVPITISVNPQSLFKNIIDVTLGAGKKQDISFALKGYADIKSGAISTTLPIDYQTTIKQYLGILPPK